MHEKQSQNNVYYNCATPGLKNTEIFGVKVFYYRLIETAHLLLSQILGGELLRSKAEGGKTSSQHFIKYLSSLIILKMYRKCTNAPFALFLKLEMLKHCIAYA